MSKDWVVSSGPDFQAALLSSQVVAGDRILLNPGIYRADYTQAAAQGVQFLVGVNGVTIMPVAGGRAIIDGSCVGRPNKDLPNIGVKGVNNTIQGIESMNSDVTCRVITLPDSHNAQRPGDGIAIGLAGQPGTGTGTRLIDCLIHDVGDAISVDAFADSVQIIGNMVFGIGWDAPDRGHGPGCYVKHASADLAKQTIVRGNIVAGTMDDAFRGYGSDPASSPVINILWDSNIALGSGQLASKGHGASRQLYAGGAVIAALQTFRMNVAYTSPNIYSAVGMGRDLGYQSLTFDDNVVIGGDIGMYMPNGAIGSQMTSCQRNTILANGQASLAQFPNNTFLPSRPTTGFIFRVIPIPEAKKAHVAVVNWGLAPTAKVDLSTCGFVDGQTYDIVDAQNPLGGAIQTFTFSAAAPLVDFKMTVVVPCAAIGPVPQAYQHTSPEFQAFIVRPAVVGSVVPLPPVVPPPVVVIPPPVTPPMTNPVSITLSPASVTLGPGQSQQFTAKVTGAVDTSYKWTLSPIIPNISNAGLYTAPAGLTQAITVTVTATSVADPTKSAMATVNLVPTIPVTPPTPGFSGIKVYINDAVVAVLPLPVVAK